MAALFDLPISRRIIPAVSRIRYGRLFLALEVGSRQLPSP